MPPTATVARAGRHTYNAPLTITVEPRQRDTNAPLRVRGTAVVFDEWTELAPRMRERVRPGALDAALADASDLLLLWGHDRNEPLSRRGVGLDAWTDERGLHFTADLPDTQRARDAVALIEAGIVRGCSFGFTIQDEEHDHRDGIDWFTITRVGRLFELTLTAVPAYETTSTEARVRADIEAGRQALAAIRARRAAGTTTVRDRSPYGPASDYSWFRDLALVTVAQANRDELVRKGVVRDGPATDADLPALPSRLHGGVDHARARLAAVPQHRDVGTSALTGMISTGGVPEFIAATFATAARAKAALANTIRREPLPQGMTIPAIFKTTQLTTGASVTVQTSENSTPSETDPVGSTSDPKVATLTGKIDASWQLLDRGAGADELFARDLGAALAEQLETQLIAGAGTSGELLGLLNVPGITTTTWNDASPTAPEALEALWQTASLVATAYGAGPVALTALHPRRAAWINAKTQTAAAPQTPRYPGQLIEAAAIPADLGAGTNEDRAIVIADLDEVILFERRPQFMVDRQTLSSTLTARLSVWQYALLVVRQPAAVGVVDGTGLVAPAGY